MFFLYQIIVTVILLFSPIILIFRLIKKKEDKIRFKEKLSIATKKKSKGNLIWFHGASVGELLSIIPLIKYYENKKYISQILITSSTVSSSKVLEKFKLKKTVHQFYPIDHLYFTNKFLKFWKPKLAVFIESEIWPCMYRNLENENIPLVLLNARLTKKTFKRWMRMKNFAQSTFNKIKISFPQNKETKLFLKKINTTNIKDLGNLKFVENKLSKKSKFNKNLIDELKKRNIWVATSTHFGEEKFCAEAHIELKKKIKNLTTIIIPRHIHRVDKIVEELKKLNLNVDVHSSRKKKLKNTDIYIVDTFGDTQQFHQVSSSVFLGGSFIKRGGQNPLEAARYGARILHGPNIDNFKDIYKKLGSLKISMKVTTPKKLASTIVFKKNKFIGDKIKNIGTKILKKTIKELDNIINNELKKT
tara:strand:- start:531 stop:1781 length:1251 start_codon:yes stop_codon:yes gene_type:complete